MIKYLFVVCIAFSLINVHVAKAADFPDATRAAQDWLGLVDSGKYAESWESAAEYFKGMVKREDWEKMVAGARKPIGNVTYRKLVSSKYATSLPGAPDGEYVVITFKSSFANKQQAIETVTPMKDRDGVWRVSGYYIK